MGKPKPPVEFATDRAPYDRQPEEPDKQWFAFKTYRDLEHGRTYRPVAERYREKYRTKQGTDALESWLSRQATRWRWRERCAEWDRTVDERIRNRKLAAIADMEARHLDLAQMASQIAKVGLSALRKAVEEAEKEGKEHLSAKDILNLASFGVTQERVVQGQPGTIEETRHRVTVDEKRGAMQKLASDPDLLNAIKEKVSRSDDE